MLPLPKPSSGRSAPAVQSRAMSLVEAGANVVAGFCMAVATQMAVFPLFGIRVTLTANLTIGAVFTIVSIARSYALRRLFEAMRVRKQRAAAHEGDGSDGGVRGQSAMR